MRVLVFALLRKRRGKVLRSGRAARYTRRAGRRMEAVASAAAVGAAREKVAV